MKKPTTAIALSAATGATAALLYRRVLRDRVLTWGATPDEAVRVLPGDELLADADIVSTRAITIAAPPAVVWPWLVQMGPGRGGAYTYDWIERLFGMEMRSADAIRPEFQQLAVGDVLPVMPNGPGMSVEVFEPERALGLRSEDGRWVWSFVLAETAGATRLLSRNRFAPRASWSERLGMLVMEPGSLVMERKMLLGIKQRAEQLARESAR